MLDAWCKSNCYKLEWLSKDIFGKKSKITRLMKVKDKDNAKYDEEWESISNFTGLDFNDPLQCEELQEVLNYLFNHLDKFGNTVLSLSIYKCFESIDLIKYFERKGYKIKITFVEHTYDQSVIFQLIKKFK